MIKKENDPSNRKQKTMPKVFLLSTNTLNEPYPVYPLGMATVASALALAGHQVRQFDFLTQGASLMSLQPALEDFNPDVVGISLRNIDTADSFNSATSWTLDLDKALVQGIKRVTSAPVVLGGSAFSIMPEEILNYVGADYGIVGNGGELFNEWIKRFGQGEQLPLIIKEDDPLKPGDRFFSPLWTETLLKDYMKSGGLIGLQTKRGCPFQCFYCTYPALEGGGFRYRETGAVIEDIRRLQKDYQVEGLFFTDSVFNDLQGHYLEIAEGLLSRDIRIRWSAFLQPLGVRAEQLRLLKRSGLFAVEAGTDGACDTTLRGLGKPFDFDEVVRFNEACLAEEIPCAHYLMFGGPGETSSTIREGLDNIDRLQNCVVLVFSGVRIFPGTPLHQKAIEDGCLAEETSLLRPVFYFSPDVDPEVMNKSLEEAFKHQRLRIFPPSVGQEKMNVLRRFGFRGPLWDTLISFRRSRNRR
jgi:lipid biosynthesis B12-binding/radical SAM protein